MPWQHASPAVFEVRLSPVPQVYRYFMTGDDGRCQEEDAKQEAEFEARAAAVRADTERLQAVRGAATGWWLPLAP